MQMQSTGRGSSNQDVKWQTRKLRLQDSQVLLVGRACGCSECDFARPAGTCHSSVPAGSQHRAFTIGSSFARFCPELCCYAPSLWLRSQLTHCLQTSLCCCSDWCSNTECILSLSCPLLPHHSALETNSQAHRHTQNTQTHRHTHNTQTHNTQTHTHTPVDQTARKMAWLTRETKGSSQL